MSYAKRDIAVQTNKGITRGPWGDKPQTSATWYEPLREQSEIDVAMRWVLRRPKLFVNTAADIHLIPKTLEAAAR